MGGGRVATAKKNKRRASWTSGGTRERETRDGRVGERDVERRTWRKKEKGKGRNE